MMRFSLLANLSIFRDKLVGATKKAPFSQKETNDQMAIFYDVTAMLRLFSVLEHRSR